MTSHIRARSLAAAFIGVAMTHNLTAARADIEDYEFQLVEKQIKRGDAIVSARLVHKPDGKLIPGAVIFTTRLDMAPDGMETMTTAIEPMPNEELGVYRFNVALPMAGGWRFSLGAKIQGETETIKNQLIFRVLP